ncbi:serine/threonine protein kinase [Synechococcales cyanobacterium C]|uniref:Serine/threonine protein kinase n=1 Tax=Petrachloros mirabilis ULC683 TaxID=2781853 RepID=A0A8K1ZY24_9CYAN|nr:serine/threonine protein kinase [Petrachloros mirabilis]NCJ05993.1 serine/threonine protein kinase [Petrachloros mirabilis ULC683]
MGITVEFQSGAVEYPGLAALVQAIYDSLLVDLKLASLRPHDPVVVYDTPYPWQLLGSGNYAAVFAHPDYPQQVVKVYAPGRPGWQQEVEVYRRLGDHPAFSACFYAAPHFLVLKRLCGVTLYDCLLQGLSIPEPVILDIDNALAFARQRGLFPHDVHGRNVMMWQGQGLVVDISDFLNPEPCHAWDDVKRGYYWLYRPLLLGHSMRIPALVLDQVRALYRCYRACKKLLPGNF